LSNVPRRVVITGLGLVCGVGNTAPEVWQQLLAGASGMAPIQGFDTTGFSVTFAAEVKNFDALNFVDKKESRKMGRFTHYAFAATQEAIAQSGLEITPENGDRVGVFIGSGIGGFEVIEREHSNLLTGGPRKISPFFIPAAIVNMAVRRPRAHFSDGHGLRDQCQLNWRCGPDDYARRCGRDDCRRCGGSGYALVGGGLCSHAGALSAQRRAHTRQQAL